MGRAAQAERGDTHQGRAAAMGIAMLNPSYVAGLLNQAELAGQRFVFFNLLEDQGF